ncbi:MAG: hypothetical protein JWP97_5408 [Labilithrix sp.]|nr:hypothetical protein [Labilithrix sp.]
MPLDAAAARAVATAMVDGSASKGGIYRQETIDELAKFVLAIFQGITANAVVTPNGSPAMAAGSTAVSGTGKIT